MSFFHNDWISYKNHEVTIMVTKKGWPTYFRKQSVLYPEVSTFLFWHPFCWLILVKDAVSYCLKELWVFFLVWWKRVCVPLFGHWEVCSIVAIQASLNQPSEEMIHWLFSQDHHSRSIQALLLLLLQYMCVSTIKSHFWYCFFAWWHSMVCCSSQ